MSQCREHVAQPRRFGWLVALALALLAVGGATPAAGAAACDHADVVFYTATDTSGRLAGELKKFPSSCTDYYLSVTPRTGAGVQGWPRGGVPLDAIHAAGPRFHAMAEIRLNPWAAYARAHGDDWYAAGLRVRELMHDAGYDPALGDTWAINEVGAPATQAMGVDVIKNIGDARRNLREFIRGLYTGDGTPMPGLVFAADPIQMTTDPAEYRTDLEGWYADSEFWEDISQYVRFWAQETYADVRGWGVAGTTLAERTAYLNDYFMHGLRLATDRGATTEAARAFFEQAYTPVGNGAYRYPPPAAIGFGSTDVDLPTMLDFVSTQTYALRSSTADRFGFADSRNGPTPASAIIAVEDRIAAAIRDSETDPSGACGVSGEWCDGAVDGAAFTGLWRELATPTPPTIVPHVEGPPGDDGWYTGDVTVTWSIADPESPVSSTSGCEATLIDFDTDGSTLTCIATSFGGTASVDVTVRRDATPPAVSCEATPSTLWPPNGRLVPVAVAVTVVDETSGAGAFALTEASSSDGRATSDIVGFQVGTPDVDGLLRAERPGTANERVYRLAYVGYDVAGNEKSCVATVVVPHDQSG